MKEIRVAQIIDSLNPGGAEMVAVNLANELANKEGFKSYLIVSRVGGFLERRVHKNVQLVLLNKKSSRDFKAIWRLFRILKFQQIHIVHAHSSSFYLPAMLKRLCGFKLVWHDHYGRKINMETGKREYPVKPFVRFFDFVYVVNKELLATDIKFFNVAANKICYLPNFSVIEEGNEVFNLKGEKSNRIVYLANLRPQKDHLNLLRAFKLLLEQRANTYLYLVGAGGNDDYQHAIEEFVAANKMENRVTWLGPVTYPARILKECGIGVLSSESEGLPLAVIEYGLAGLSVVATAVGELPSMLTPQVDALLVAPNNPIELSNALLEVLNNNSFSRELAKNLKKLMESTYSSNAVMSQLVADYHNILNR
jgi:glycosyltransferase involved in cell wall biosynthesis